MRYKYVYVATAVKLSGVPSSAKKDELPKHCAPTLGNRSKDNISSARDARENKQPSKQLTQ